MSFEAYRAVWMLQLPPRLKLVAAALADYAGRDGGNIFPGLTELQAKTGLHRRTIQRSRRELITRKILEIEVPSRGGRPTRYRFTASCMTPELRPPAAVVLRQSAVVASQTAATGRPNHGDGYVELRPDAGRILHEPSLNQERAVARPQRSTAASPRASGAAAAASATSRAFAAWDHLLCNHGRSEDPVAKAALYEIGGWSTVGHAEPARIGSFESRFVRAYLRHLTDEATA